MGTPSPILLQNCLTDWPSLPLNLWAQAWCLWCQHSKHRALHVATDTTTLLPPGADSSHRPHHSHWKDSAVSLAMGLNSDSHYDTHTHICLADAKTCTHVLATRESGTFLIFLYKVGDGLYLIG